ncbi:ATP-dependent nuclease [Qipengyuania sp. CAU 1752]
MEVSMQLIREIEISYFRSFYKAKLRNMTDLNIVFGKNDSGKSNIVRALNLFFNGTPDHNQEFEFPIDFSEFRASEAEQSDDVRKFLYVKVTFNTPQSFRPSLGDQFYVKRQWTVSRGQDYHEEMSTSIPSNRRHIAKLFLNKIRFIYIPAIKDVTIFEMLLSNIHEVIAESDEFLTTIGDLSENLHELTQNMFDSLPTEVATSTRIGAPKRMKQMFQTLDFETLSEGESNPKSLTRQRGDGVKVRHIPELLKFISDGDGYDFHIWGFEEPENSLDFVAAQSEAKRFLSLAEDQKIQVLMTTHSPSFYNLDDDTVSKFYVRKGSDSNSEIVQGNGLVQIDVHEGISEGFYLPAVSAALKDLSVLEQRAKAAESNVTQLRQELEQIARPVVLTEGRTDALILRTAWSKLRAEELPYEIRSCETGGENAGSGNGGASTLAIRVKGVAHDHPHPVLALFDLDAEGVKAFKLDRNFVEIDIDDFDVKKGMHGQAYAACLPAPEFCQDCEEVKNLPIEFLFPDEVLLTEHDGERLTLNRMQATRQVGTAKVDVDLPDETKYKMVGRGKELFAEQIVPNLGEEAFAGFEPVLNLIESVFEFNAVQE